MPKAQGSITRWDYLSFQLPLHSCLQSIKFWYFCDTVLVNFRLWNKGVSLIREKLMKWCVFHVLITLILLIEQSWLWYHDSCFAHMLINSYRNYCAGKQCRFWISFWTASVKGKAGHRKLFTWKTKNWKIMKNVSWKKRASPKIRFSGYIFYEGFIFRNMQVHQLKGSTGRWDLGNSDTYWLAKVV